MVVEIVVVLVAVVVVCAAVGGAIIMMNHHYSYHQSLDEVSIVVDVDDYCFVGIVDALLGALLRMVLRMKLMTMMMTSCPQDEYDFDGCDVVAVVGDCYYGVVVMESVLEW